MSKRNRRNEAREGYSLVELVVALAVLSVVIGYVLTTFSAQHETYAVQDQVIEAQQNLRAISELIEREIRVAGMLIPESNAICGSAGPAGSTRSEPPRGGFMRTLSFEPPNGFSLMPPGLTNHLRLPISLGSTPTAQAS